MIDYYNYDTSPRKIEPEYEVEEKVSHTSEVKKTRTRKQQQQHSRVQETRKNLKRILYIGIAFIILFVISYRYAVINIQFEEKESLKSELADIQKQNQQLKVNIEQGMNINTVEQQAKERLGMQKMDNSQKVYINLDKSDYVESSTSTSNGETTQTETWWSKLLKDLFKIK